MSTVSLCRKCSKEGTDDCPSPEYCYLVDEKPYFKAKDYGVKPITSNICGARASMSTYDDICDLSDLNIIDEIVNAYRENVRKFALEHGLSEKEVLDYIFKTQIEENNE